MVESPLGPEADGTLVYLLDEVYAHPTQTPFQATVVKGRNTFNFDLQSEPDVKFVPPPGWHRRDR